MQTETTQMTAVPIDSLDLDDGLRQGMDEAELNSLSCSIERYGLLTPPVCVESGGQLRILKGARSVRAAKLLGETEVPVLVLDYELSEAEILTRRLVCHIHRVDLNPIERALGIRSLMEEAGITASEASERLCRSESTVSRWLKLLTLSEQHQALIASGKIPADVGYMLAGIDDISERDRYVDEVLGNRLSRDALARKLKRTRRSQETRRGTRVSAPLGEGQTVTIVGSDLTLDSVTLSLESLLAKAKKAKAQGITLQTFVRTLKDQSKARQGAAP